MSRKNSSSRLSSKLNLSSTPWSKICSKNILQVWLKMTFSGKLTAYRTSNHNIKRKLSTWLIRKKPSRNKSETSSSRKSKMLKKITTCSVTWSTKNATKTVTGYISTWRSKRGKESTMIPPSKGRLKKSLKKSERKIRIFISRRFKRSLRKIQRRSTLMRSWLNRLRPKRTKSEDWLRKYCKNNNWSVSESKT